MGQEGLEKSVLEINEARRKYRTFVRFSRDEYIRIQKDSELYSLSPASLLREKYFRDLPPNLLMPPEAHKKFLRIYQGLGNNLNQLTKRAHLGFKVPEKEIKDFQNISERLYEIVRKLSGNR